MSLLISIFFLSKPSFTLISREVIRESVNYKFAKWRASTSGNSSLGIMSSLPFNREQRISALTAIISATINYWTKIALEALYLLPEYRECSQRQHSWQWTSGTLRCSSKGVATIEDRIAYLHICNNHERLPLVWSLATALLFFNILHIVIKLFVISLMAFSTLLM